MEDKCKCPWISSMVNDPNVPIEYSEKVKKFLFKYNPRKNVYNFLYIYYCPCCGGKLTSLNKKDIIPEKELKRLKAVTEKILTPKDALGILGKPDYKQENGVYEWHSHSKTAVIEGKEFHPNKFFLNFRKK